MDDKLKELLKRLLESNNVSVVRVGEAEADGEGDDACSIESDLDEMKNALAEVPDINAAPDKIIEFGFKFFSDFVNTIAKEGRVKGLEVELDLARKPDDVDLESEEHAHSKLHFEYRRLLSQRLVRESVVLSRFLSLARAGLANSSEGGDEV